jgi:hypothetical protein
MPTVTVEFTPTREDYVGAMRAYTLSDRATMWFMFPFFSSIFLFGCFGLFVSLSTGISSSFVWLLLIFLAAFLPLLIYVIVPFRAGLQAQRQERMRSPTSYTFDDEKVVLKNQFVESKMDWGTLGKMVETTRFFLFVYKTNRPMLHLVPKRAFPTPAAEAEFRDLAAAHIRVRQDETRGWTVARVSLLILAILLAVFSAFAIPSIVTILLRR